MKKYEVITVAEREISCPVIFDTFEEAHKEMEKQVHEILDGEKLDDYGEIGKDYAWIDDLYGNNFDFAIYEI